MQSVWSVWRIRSSHSVKIRALSWRQQDDTTNRLPGNCIITGYSFPSSIQFAIHGYCTSGTVRKVKNDRKDALKIARFALDRWTELREYTPMDALRQQLKIFSRQYNLYIKSCVALQSNLISLTDKVFRESQSCSKALREQTVMRSGWTLSRPFGIVSASVWLVKMHSQIATRSGASAWDTTSPRQKHLTSISRASVISSHCRKTTTRSC